MPAVLFSSFCLQTLRSKMQTAVAQGFHPRIRHMQSFASPSFSQCPISRLSSFSFSPSSSTSLSAPLPDLHRLRHGKRMHNNIVNGPQNFRDRLFCPFSSCFGGSPSVSPFATISANAAAENSLVGNMAPDFEAEAVFNGDFTKVKLSDYIGKSYVILFFYPLDFTFVCPTEITAFSDRYSEFEKLETKIIGISTDSVFSHLAWVQVDRKAGGLGDLQYPLVSDITKGISRAYSVLIRDQGVALRGLFIIDKSGIIQYATINNLRFGRSIDETLRVLQAIQYVQEHPEQVCPAGWKPGDKTITSNPTLSKGYFAGA